MKNLFAKLSFCTAILASVASSHAYASLAVGAQAPDFTTMASQGGNEFSYHLKDALKKGPVVLYFYPAAFTKGCTVEAHDFAEAIPHYKSLGASVIGVSTDPIETLKKFSVSECRSTFPVAEDPNGTITTTYDARDNLQKRANRTSYVIAPNGTIVMSYTNNDPDEHVERTLNAIKRLNTHDHTR
ncbi:redoxin domain-containing protein [Saccharibacter sp. 17.LH.SD]|uniref:peroxiredoxin n=1 Tax=Saccharibacter sp. 17.LH.SD TaxID=2689393 RepID=UPI00136A2965|nr:peroxiredoxin [Saccharibacter sp. 17.LH.SD]MXV45281.1 redoxin domain-containing protein [Saccharibacter sp. 17.LH.SD]